MQVEYYDFGDRIYCVMGGDAIMNAHRKEERQASREAIYKARLEKEKQEKGEQGMTEKDGFRYCDRCGVLLTNDNNKCGYEICDKCNEWLESQEKGEQYEN